MTHLLELDVVDGSLDECVVKIAGGKLCHLCKEKVTELLKRLAVLGGSHHYETAVIGLDLTSGISIEGFLLLDDVQVDKACLAVGKDGSSDVCDG